MSESRIRQALARIQAPYLDVDLIRAGAVESIRAQGDEATVNLRLGFALDGPDGARQHAQHAIAEQLSETTGLAVTVQIACAIGSHAVQANLTPLPGVKNIIAVASGKGGVGKSTVSANLALALADDGARIGLLDADIYGPSQPRMFGATARPQSPDGKSMLPVEAHGIQTMSIGYLIDVNEPTIWRGPMVTQALMQLLTETRWDDLDYLIIDLPPGTGDTQLSLVQKIPVSGAVVVSTPQDIALLDARKGLEMFRKVSVPVLGVVENMAVHICENCGHESYIFGEAGGQKMAEDTGAPLLGQLPLMRDIRLQADAGTPIIREQPDGAAAQGFREIARRTAAQLAGQLAGQGHVFPKITVVDD